MVPPKFDVLRSVLVAGVSTLLVVGVGLAVGLSGEALPDTTGPSTQRVLAGATTEPREPAPAPDDSATATRAEAELERLARTVAKKAEKTARNKAERDRATARNKPAQVPAQVPARQAARSTGGSYSFQLAAFNILGSNHTRPGGTANGYAPGRMRAEWAARLVTSRGLDIVGWSEIQADQYDAMMRATGGEFEGWPGHALGSRGIPASLMWRTSMFEAVWKSEVTIPFMGQQRPMPVVQLRERSTGREFFVMNVHNAPQGRQAERDAALNRELPVVSSIRKESGLPVFLVGDFNERETLFCKVTGRTDLRSPRGGSNDGTCRPPTGRLRVDWIFGSPEASFSGYREEQDADVRRITDHAVLWTDVTVN